ncbi:MAG: 4'-phosphopantetheinyl transferase superfamily protein [Rhodocyclaceae bacterium]|nr:4'-phosphopantetheinyl transferase superfamily protein [Rhodocyclaceae bacterium]MDZ4216501.1 4'-phosphopantetheinyl transferase superfamily protein [Rhodocyclaceae bacterium]
MMNAAWAELLPRGARWHTTSATDSRAPVVAHGAAGEPLWPAGIVGSVTHADGYRIIATAPADRVATLGIDMEPLAPLPAEVWPHFLDGDELAELRALPAPQRGLAALSLWCLKEALFKALNGRVPFDCLPLRHESGRWRPAVTLWHRLPGFGLDPARLELKTTSTDGWQYAAAWQHNNA